ncbi:MAG: isoprenyl transferase [Lentisphaeria bacterium]|nr:isoprenyl transferase [Lentisphaeria bacterium]
MDKTDSLKHIAIIMDGNGRWAKERDLPRSEGHSAGARRVIDIMESMRKHGISYVTLYAFSTENWKRSQEEVSFLMDLLAQFLDENQQKLKENKIRLLVTGRMEELPEFCVERLNKVIQSTSEDYQYTLILALNYGGRQEITDAVRKIGNKIKAGEIDPDSISEQTVADHLYLPGIPDPDLMIRTSGEERISNFLLWQLSYAEFYFTDIYWPDFDDAELDKAINTYYKRNRRFGGRP